MNVEVDENFFSEFDYLSKDKEHDISVILEQCISVVRIQKNYIKQAQEVSIDDQYITENYKTEIDFLREYEILKDNKIFLTQLGNLYIALAQKKRKYLIKDLGEYFLVVVTEKSNILDLFKKTINFNAIEENQSFCWVTSFDAEVIYFEMEHGCIIVIAKKI